MAITSGMMAAHVPPRWVVDAGSSAPARHRAQQLQYGVLHIRRGGLEEPPGFDAGRPELLHAAEELGRRHAQALREGVPSACASRRRAARRRTTRPRLHRRAAAPQRRGAASAGAAARRPQVLRLWTELWASGSAPCSSGTGSRSTPASSTCPSRDSSSKAAVSPAAEVRPARAAKIALTLARTADQ